jgi:branched-chain amino acid transport system substrate-binding protein
VGAAVSATGSGAEAGQLLTEGYKLWEEQVNQRGGLLGRPVQLTILDDASDPSTGSRLYEQLINETRVDLLLGPYASSAAITASTVSEKYKIPLLLPGRRPPTSGGGATSTSSASTPPPRPTSTG